MCAYLCAIVYVCVCARVRKVERVGEGMSLDKPAAGRERTTASRERVVRESVLRMMLFIPR